MTFLVWRCWREIGLRWFKFLQSESCQYTFLLSSLKRKRIYQFKLKTKRIYVFVIINNGILEFENADLN